jgi:hypothetical protein
MKMIRFAYLAWAAVLFLALGVASNIMGAELFQQAVEREFMAGFQGDAAALARGMNLCEEALAEDPNNADALVWHGTGLYFGAGEAAKNGDYESAAELMHRGLGEMDKAVTLQPGNSSVRVTRGMTLLNAARYGAPNPESLFATVTTDFEKVIASAGDGWPRLPAPLRAEVLFGLAEACHGTGDAAKAKIYMERVTAEHAGTPQAERAQAWLAKN